MLFQKESFINAWPIHFVSLNLAQRQVLAYVITKSCITNTKYKFCMTHHEEHSNKDDTPVLISHSQGVHSLLYFAYTCVLGPIYWGGYLHCKN